MKKLKKFWLWLVGESYAKKYKKIEYEILPPENIRFDVMTEIADYRRLSKCKHIGTLIELAIYDIAYSHCKWLDKNYNQSNGHANFNERVEQIQLRYPNITKVGENVSYNYFKPKSIVEAWKASKTHNDNLLGDFTHVAVASYGKFTTAIFVKVE